MRRERDIEALAERYNAVQVLILREDIDALDSFELDFETLVRSHASDCQ